MAEWLALLFRIWEVRHSKSDPSTIHPGNDFSRFYSIAYRRFCDRSVKLRHDRVLKVSLFFARIIYRTSFQDRNVSGTYVTLATPVRSFSMLSVII